jgi:hypothetical protein
MRFAASPPAFFSSMREMRCRCCSLRILQAYAGCVSTAGSEAVLLQQYAFSPFGVVLRGAG